MCQPWYPGGADPLLHTSQGTLVCQTAGRTEAEKEVEAKPGGDSPASLHCSGLRKKKKKDQLKSEEKYKKNNNPRDHLVDMSVYREQLFYRKLDT